MGGEIGDRTTLETRFAGGKPNVADSRLFLLLVYVDDAILSSPGAASRWEIETAFCVAAKIDGSRRAERREPAKQAGVSGINEIKQDERANKVNRISKISGASEINRADSLDGAKRTAFENPLKDAEYCVSLRKTKNQKLRVAEGKAGTFAAEPVGNRAAPGASD